MIKQLKLPKWTRWGLLFLGILTSLSIAIFASTQFWVSTWPVFNSDGLNFNYPPGWYLQHYSLGPGATSFQTHFSPQPQFYQQMEGAEKVSVVDLSKVSFQAQADVYDKNDMNDNESLNSLNDQISKYKYMRISNNGYLSLNLSAFDYIVITKNKAYEITGSIDPYVKANLFSEKFQFMEGLLAALSLHY